MTNEHQSLVNRIAMTIGRDVSTQVRTVTHRLAMRDFSEDERKTLAKSGAALPDGSYPIMTVTDLRNAIQAYGRSNPSDRAKIKAHIMKRARALGAADLIPDAWD